MYLKHWRRTTQALILHIFIQSTVVVQARMQCTWQLVIQVTQLTTQLTSQILLLLVLPLLVVVQVGQVWAASNSSNPVHISTGQTYVCNIEHCSFINIISSAIVVTMEVHTTTHASSPGCDIKSTAMSGMFILAKLWPLTDCLLFISIRAGDYSLLIQQFVSSVLIVVFFFLSSYHSHQYFTLYSVCFPSPIRMAMK